MWNAVLGSKNLFPNLEAALKGVFNRVLKNLRKARATIPEDAFFSFSLFRRCSLFQMPPTACRRARRLRRTRALSVTQANMARKRAQQLWCIAKQVLAGACDPHVGRLCHARQRPSLLTPESLRRQVRTGHINLRRKSARTHVETARPPSENSPLAKPNTLCALASSPDVSFI